MSAEKWEPTPGEEAAIVWQAGSRHQVELVRVERVLKRDVVLTNGQRFNVGHLSKREGGAWGTTKWLVPRSDPRVDTAIQEGRRYGCYREVRDNCETAVQFMSRYASGEQDALTSAVEHLDAARRAAGVLP